MCGVYVGVIWQVSGWAGCCVGCLYCGCMCGVLLVHSDGFVNLCKHHIYSFDIFAISFRYTFDIYIYICVCRSCVECLLVHV